jgi:DNA repair exonuclease SbcCD ATPase subunit
VTDLPLQRRPKPKPAATQEEIAAQIAQRIAQLSAKPAATAPQQPSVKVKSIAELRSTKIARLTTKIAVNEAEIARLEREYAAAKDRLDRETQALDTRRDALAGAVKTSQGMMVSVTDPKTKATLALMDEARAKLELVADRAQDLLGKFRGGEISERATMRELKNLLEGAKDGGCDVANLCQMVTSSLDFGQVADADTTQAEIKTVRKRKVEDVRAEERKARESLAKLESAMKSVEVHGDGANRPLEVANSDEKEVSHGDKLAI